jgi:regulator of RNase E activity RraB
MGIFKSLFGLGKKLDRDESVLAELKKVGSDLSKPHGIEFFLYLPSEDAARQAAEKLTVDGFDVEPAPAAEGTDWVCVATKTMIPNLADVQRISGKLETLAASLGGVYDGWGSPVVD